MITTYIIVLKVTEGLWKEEQMYNIKLLNDFGWTGKMDDGDGRRSVQMWRVWFQCLENPKIKMY